MDPVSSTPRELRQRFVSQLTSSGMPIEDIAHLVGDANTPVTELVYRKELRPVLTRGAVAMDALFPTRRVRPHIGKQKSDPPGTRVRASEQKTTRLGLDLWPLGEEVRNTHS
jgi:hypothetical protein